MKGKAFRSRFNRLFDKSTHHYTDSVGNNFAQHRALPAALSHIVVGMALSVRSSAASPFCRMKTPVAYSLTMVQPPRRRDARAQVLQKVLDEVTDYYLNKEKSQR